MGIPDILRSTTNKLNDTKHPWRYPHLSIGPQCATISGLKCWEATGPALDLMKDIALEVKKVLDDNAELIEEGEVKPRTITYRIWMIGYDENSAAPNLVLSSRSRKQRKVAKKLLKQSQVIIEHPELRIRTQEKMPALLRTDKGNLKTWTDEYVEARVSVVKVHCGLCGMLVCINNNCLATVSGVIILDENYWGIIPRHSCLNLQQDAGDLNENVGSFAFDDDSDDECIDNTRTHKSRFVFPSIKLTHQCSSFPATETVIGSMSSDDESPSSDASESSSNSEEPFQRRIDSLSVFDSSQRDENGEKEPIVLNEKDEIARFLVNSAARDVDYEIFPLEKRRIYHPNRTLLPESTIAPRKYLQIEDTMQHPKNGPIWALTGNTGCVKGNLLENPCYMKIGGSKPFQEMWQVRLERQSSNGDSGSWVVDAVTGSVYGHIVAGDPTSNLVFIAPIASVFKDIEARFQSKPRLPTAKDFIGPSHFEKELSPSDIIQIGMQKNTSFILFVHGGTDRLEQNSWGAPSVKTLTNCSADLCNGSASQLYRTTELSLPFLNRHTPSVLVGRGPAAKRRRSSLKLTNDYSFWIPMRFLARFLTTTVRAPYGEPTAGLQMMQPRPHDDRIFRLIRSDNAEAMSEAFSNRLASPYDVFSLSYRSLVEIVASTYGAFPSPSSYGSLVDIAILFGSADIIRLLLRSKVDVFGGKFWSSYGSPSFHAWRAILEDYYPHHTRDQMISLFPDMPVEFGFSRVTRLILKLESGDVGRAMEDSIDYPNTYDGAGNTAIYWACLCDNAEIVKQLLDAGSDPNVLNGPLDITPLMVACKKLSVECVELLLGAGADPNLQSSLGDTAMSFLLRFHRNDKYSSIEIAKLLLKHGIDIWMSDGEGTGRIHLAAQANSPELMDLLLDNGANPEQKDIDRKTPLSVATATSAHLSVKHLLRQGVSTTVTDIDDRTILHLSARFPSIEVAEVLLNSGISNLDPELVDAFGKRAIEYIDDSKFRDENTVIKAVNDGDLGGARKDVPHLREKFNLTFRQLIARLRNSYMADLGYLDSIRAELSGLDNDEEVSESEDDTPKTPTFDLTDWKGSDPYAGSLAASKQVTIYDPDREHMLSLKKHFEQALRIQAKSGHGDSASTNRK